MVAYLYSQEYRQRFEFFMQSVQTNFERSYRKLLTVLPNGVIVLDRNNDAPMFYNRVVAKVVSRKLGQSSTHSLTRTSNPERQAALKEVAYDT